MREIWRVTIYSVKDGKKDIYETETTSKNMIARIILTFKPKGGYEVVKYRIEKEWWLV